MLIIFLFFITMSFTISPMATPCFNPQNAPVEQVELDDQDNLNQNNIVYGPMTLEEFQLQLQDQNINLEEILADQ